MLRVTDLSIVRPVSRPPTPTQPDKRLATCDSGSAGICARHRETTHRPQAKTYIHRHVHQHCESRTSRHGTRRDTRAVTTTTRIPIVPLNPSCALPALAQPMSLFLILVPENPCLTCADRSLRYCTRWPDTLTTSSDLTFVPLIRIHKRTQSHDIKIAMSSSPPQL